MIPDWTHAEPFDAVVLCLAAGFALLVLVSFVLDWMRHTRIKRQLEMSSDDEAYSLAAIMDEFRADALINDQESDDVEGLRQW